jgi:hypothetical protein
MGDWLNVTRMMLKKSGFLTYSKAIARFFMKAARDVRFDALNFIPDGFACNRGISRAYHIIHELKTRREWVASMTISKRDLQELTIANFLSNY